MKSCLMCLRNARNRVSTIQNTVFIYSKSNNIAHGTYSTSFEFYLLAPTCPLRSSSHVT